MLAAVLGERFDPMPRSRSALSRAFFYPKIRRPIVSGLVGLLLRRLVPTFVLLQLRLPPLLLLLLAVRFSGACFGCVRRGGDPRVEKGVPLGWCCEGGSALKAGGRAAGAKNTVRLGCVFVWSALGRQECQPKRKKEFENIKAGIVVMAKEGDHNVVVDLGLEFLPSLPPWVLDCCEAALLTYDGVLRKDRARFQRQMSLVRSI